MLLGSEPLEKALLATDLSQLKLLPSDIDLVGAEIELVGIERRESRLREALGAADDDGWTIIDCPPSLGLLTINALVAADSVLVPLQCEFYALEGLTHLLKTVKLVRERLNPGLEVGGIVLTMFDGRTSMARPDPRRGSSVLSRARSSRPSSHATSGSARRPATASP